MTEDQQFFQNFILERIQPGKEEDVKAIMAESFKRQAEGTFSPEYMAEVMPKMVALLKPECVEEFMGAAAHFKSEMNKA